MTAAGDQSGTSLRRTVYVLLIAISAATMVGRVLSVRSANGGTPLLSANDRSRWGTVRALVDEGTFELDHVIFQPGGERDREWYTIDLVRHRGQDGREHYYSSKPPLLATLLAGPYWLVRQSTGAGLEDQPFYVERLLLLLTQVLPLVGYFVLLALLIEQFGESDWSRIFVMAAATWGTFLTTFAVTVNNHLPAAISVLIAAYAAVRALRRGTSQSGWYAAAGFFGAMAVANELPALSFFGLLALVLGRLDPKRTCLVFAPAALVVVAAFFGTNYWAHGSWRIPYAHRQDGPAVARIDAAASPLEAGPLPETLRLRLAAEGVDLSEHSELQASHTSGRWILWDSERRQRYALRVENGLELRGWDNWYEYENSYWLPDRKRGVDRGEPSRTVYAFHVLFGHRGMFSLTPVWLLSVAGIGIWLWRGPALPRGFAFIVGLVSVVCLAFYLSRPLEDRNYGGVAGGFRWMFWLIPLWLLCALPAADWMAGRRWSRGVAWALLSISVLSATYVSRNPWSHSWIFDYWTHLGWIRY
jgi:hypothetical protein